MIKANLEKLKQQKAEAERIAKEKAAQAQRLVEEKAAEEIRIAK